MVTVLIVMLIILFYPIIPVFFPILALLVFLLKDIWQLVFGWTINLRFTAWIGQLLDLAGFVVMSTCDYVASVWLDWTEDLYGE